MEDFNVSDMFILYGPAQIGPVCRPGALWARMIQFYIKLYGIIPGCIIGLLTNALVIWVWSKDVKHGCTVHLFKALALSDSLFMVGYIGFFFSSIYCFAIGEQLLLCFTFGNEFLSLHITMLLAVARWIGFNYPYEAQALLSRFRINCAVAFVTVWILTLYILFHIFRNLYGAVTLPVVSFFHGLLLVFAPCMVQTVIMLVLVRQVTRFLKTSTGSRTRANVEESRYVFALMYMVALNFFIFIIIGSVLTIFRGMKSLRPVRFITNASFTLLTILNSIANFIFYLVFIKRFRDLLHLRVSMLLHRCGFTHHVINKVEPVAGNVISF